MRFVARTTFDVMVPITLPVSSVSAYQPPALKRSVFLCTAALDYMHGEVNKLGMPAVTIFSVKGANNGSLGLVLEKNVAKNVTFQAAPCLYSRNYSVWAAYRFLLVKAKMLKLKKDKK